MTNYDTHQVIAWVEAEHDDKEDHEPRQEGSSEVKNLKEVDLDSWVPSAPYIEHHSWETRWKELKAHENSSYDKEKATKHEKENKLCWLISEWVAFQHAWVSIENEEIKDGVRWELSKVE